MVSLSGGYQHQLRLADEPVVHTPLLKVKVEEEGSADLADLLGGA